MCEADYITIIWIPGINDSLYIKYSMLVYTKETLKMGKLNIHCAIIFCYCLKSQLEKTK